MKQIEDTISTLVQNHFPQFYNEDGETFVEFVKEYYRWMESPNNSVHFSRNLLEFRDIDSTVDEFLVHFKNKYLAEAPVFYDRTRSNVKHALDFYRSKGTEQGTKVLFNEVFGISDVDVYFPGRDVIKASDGEWYIPVYLEVSLSNKTSGFIGKQITGSFSSATAFVEGVARKSVKGKHFDVLILTNRQGDFVIDDIITADGDLTDCPVVIGSLTKIKIDDSGRGFAVGDIVDIVSARLGKQGKARIDSITDSTGKVTFSLVDGGSGYRLTTVPVVAQKTILVNNKTSSDPYIPDFLIDEIIIQPLANIVFNSSNSVFSVGDLVTGSNSTADVATGRVLGKTQNQISGLGTANSTSNTVIGTGTGVSFNTQIANGDYIRFQSCTTIYQVHTTTNATHLTLTTYGPNVTANSMVIANGHMLLIVTSGNFGSADRIKNTTVLTGTASSNATSPQVNGNNTLFSSELSTGDYIKFSSNNTIFQVSSVTNNTVLILTTNGPITTANTITYNPESLALIDSYTDKTATGILMGVNSGAIGLTSVSNTFSSNGYNFVYGQTSNVYANLVTIGTGSGANISIGSLTDKETVYLNEDLLKSNNAITDTILTGSASANSTSPQVNGVGSSFTTDLYRGSYIKFSSNNSVYQVNSISNDTVLILTSNGPDVTANTVTVKPGPYLTLPLNSLKYGLPKLQTANLSTIMNLALTRGSYDIGTIASLSGINPGTGYNIRPFVQVRDPAITAFNRKDLHVELENRVGSFVVGEEIAQNFSRPSYTFSMSGSNVSFTSLETVTQQINATSNNYGEVASSNTSVAVLYTSGNFVNSAIGADLSGSITSNATSSQVNGTLTLFTSELSTNDYIKFSGNNLIFQVNNIVNNTVLFLKTTSAVLTGANTVAKVTNVAVGMTSGKYFFVNTAISNTVISASRGSVLGIGVNSLDIKRKTFNQSFTESVSITGAFSGATANVVSVTQIEYSEMMGNNAVILTSAGVVNGSIGTLSVIDSGYAYEDGEDITITKQGSAYVATGYANLLNQGTGEGYFKSTRGFLNSDKYIHDGKFYQAFSYQVRASVPLGVYGDTLKQLCHVAGTELFGNLIKSSNVDVQITSVGIEIET